MIPAALCYQLTQTANSTTPVLRLARKVSRNTKGMLSKRRKAPFVAARAPRNLTTSLSRVVIASQLIAAVERPLQSSHIGVTGVWFWADSGLPRQLACWRATKSPHTHCAIDDAFLPWRRLAL